MLVIWITAVLDGNQIHDVLLARHRLPNKSETLVQTLFVYSSLCVWVLSIPVSCKPAAILLGGVGHCFAWHVQVPAFCNLFIFLISMNMT